MKVAAKGDAA
jgi:hypothetical protein